MANANTATAEERDREREFTRARQEGQNTPGYFADAPHVFSDAGDATAALRMARYGLNDVEQQAASRENLRHVRSARSLSQNLGRTAQVAGSAVEAGGALVQGTGKATEFAGRGITAGGQAIMRAGAALSGTGVGAIAGVPLALVGGAVAGTGAVTQGAGKVAGAVGKGVEAGGHAARGAGREVRQLGGQVRQTGSMLPSGIPGGSSTGFGRPAAMGGGVPNAAGMFASASRSMGAAAQRLSQNVPVPGGDAAAKLAQKIADIFQDVLELVGTSVTVVGLLYAIPKLHHRLIWGNFLGGKFLPAKPMAAPVFWAAVTILLDTILGIAFLFLAFLFYVITNPCEVFADVVLPDFFSFLKPAMVQHCPDKVIEKIIDIIQ